MGDSDDPPRLPTISHATVDRFAHLYAHGPPRPASAGPWGLSRAVLKAWYDAANRVRAPSWRDVEAGARYQPLFRTFTEAAPHMQDPMVPALLDYSPLPFEDYARCHICTHLGPEGNGVGPGVSFTMYLFIEAGQQGRWRPEWPYWVSTVDASFTAHVAPHIHPGNVFPMGLENALAMLGPECAGMEIFPNRPAICPPKMMWAKVRWAVAVRPWMLAWLEEYAERLGGPEGRWHQEERLAFAKGFCA